MMEKKINGNLRLRISPHALWIKESFEMKTVYVIMIALALPLAAASTSRAQCDKGCSAGKVCKLVKVEKTVKTICYGVKCKDICISGCGSGCTTTKCGTAGDKADCRDGCSAQASCKVSIPTGKPGCSAKRKTVKQLVKYEKSIKVISYEWRIVDADCGCDASDDVAAASGKGR